MTLDSGIHARVKFNTRIDAVCDPTSSRYALHAVECRDIGNGTVYAAATDGRCAAVVVAEGELEPGLDTVLVPAAVAKPPAGGKGKQRVDKGAMLNGEWRRGDKVAPKVEGRFPRLHDALPMVGEDYLVLGLTASLLENVAQAIGGDEGIVYLVIPKEKPNKDGVIPRMVTGGVPIVGANGIGVIMPCANGSDPEGMATIQANAYTEQADAYRKICTGDKPVVESPPVNPAFADYTPDERKRYDETVTMLAYARLPAPDPADWLARVRSAK